MALYKQLLPDSLKQESEKLPKKVSKTNPEKLKGRTLINYLLSHPDARGYFHLYGITSGLISKLLIKCPQFANQCDLSKITRWFISDIVIAQPHLITRFNTKGLDWIHILSRQPALFAHSPFRQFDTYDWCRLIKLQPRLAGRCPWQTLNFVREWRDAILLHPDLVLKYREDWKPYHHLGGYSWSKIVDLLTRAPHLESMVNARVREELGAAAGTGNELKWTVFNSGERVMILKSQPQFIRYCDTGDFRPDEWKEIIKSQPQLFKYLIRFWPQLVQDSLSACRAEEWEDLLPKHPEYLLLRNGRCYSFISSVRVFLLAGLLDFNGSGLDTICNPVYDILQRPRQFPTGLFAQKDISPAEFIISSVMDPSNAECYFISQLKDDNWKFIEELIPDGLETMHGILNREKFSFFLCAAAPERTWRKYLDHCDDPASIRDKNGNTLLHAALMRAAFDNIRSILEPDDGNPAFSLYVYLIGKGCDPEVKNKRGVSCRGLLSLLQNKVRSDLL